MADVGQVAVVVGLERVIEYIVAEQNIKTWTPISLALAMEHLVQKDGCPKFFDQTQLIS
jgi:hypothetical protein